MREWLHDVTSGTGISQFGGEQQAAAPEDHVCFAVLVAEVEHPEIIGLGGLLRAHLTSCMLQRRQAG